MIKVKIGESEREGRDADPQWINEQINGRRRDGINVCVRVTIESSQVNLLLTTPSCARSVGRPRPLREDEKIVLTLWEKHHLNSDGFASGDVISFLRQLR